MICSALAGERATDIAATVTVSGDKYEVRTGKPDQPGYLLMTGVRQSDGRLHMTGNGISGMQKFRGNPFKAEFDGKMIGERYEAAGLLGRRECTLKMARK